MHICEWVEFYCPLCISPVSTKEKNTTETVCTCVCVCVCVCVVVVFKRQREPRVLTCTFLIYARTQSFSQANYYKIIRDVALNNLANRPVDKTIFFSLLICFKYFTDRNNDFPP